MTPEELLKPRWKVIADYPNSPFVIGQIFVIPNFDKDFTKKYWADDKDKYPHLFQRLQWWEDRSDEDMPEYYKHKDFGWVADSVGIYNTTICFRGRNDVIEWHVQNLIPATEAEYLEYIKKGGDYE